MDRTGADFSLGDRPKRFWLVSKAFSLLWALAFAGCPAPAPPRLSSAPPVIRREQFHMHTYVSIAVAAPESAAALEAIEAAFSEVRRLSAGLSEYEPSSQVSAVNRASGIGPVAVGAELFALLETALEVAEASDGAFDPTVAPLFELWPFRALDPRPPRDAAIAARLGLVGYRHVLLDRTRQTVLLDLPGMKVGLGAIAKGFIVDAASAALRQRGFRDHLVVAGGDLFASGRRGDRRWRVGVRDPEGSALTAAFEAEDEGVATSGDYERFFVFEGVRYHHLLDPATGRPARGVRSATAFAKTAALADAYATALFVLGPERGLRLAVRKGIEAYFLDDALAPEATPGLQARLKPAPR